VVQAAELNTNGKFPKFPDRNFETQDSCVSTIVYVLIFMDSCIVVWIS